MTKLKFRSTSPRRTCTKTYASYKSYKPFLATDFNNRCGYTDCQERWLGGKNTFHIDHFKPHSLFPSLKQEYSNLVYSCSYVNILKSDDDPENYLDPCVEDLNQHFYRDSSGTIFPFDNSPRAVYMHKNLKLGLARYGFIWLIENCYDMMKKLQVQVATLPEDSPKKKELKDLHFEFSTEFTKYFDYLTTRYL